MSVLPLTGYLPEEINHVLGLSPAFRGRQIFQDIWRHGRSIPEMTTLPLSLREKLETEAAVSGCSVVRSAEDTDGTVKLVVRCTEDAAVETVILSDDAGRNTACLSTQAGCAMGCTFCKTGMVGFKRNLRAFEITDQYLAAVKTAGSIDSVVFMGMGEPLANLDAVRKTIRILSHPLGRGMSLRRMTISTCGLVSGIRSLTAEGPHVRLAVSLITAEQRVRETLMPAAQGNPLGDLQAALMEYQESGGKRVTLEYVLIPGINDSLRAVNALKDFLLPLNAMVNIIPWNPVPEMDYTRPDSRQIRGFLEKLEARKIRFTRRYTRGRGINGACGQLGASWSDEDRPDPADSR